MTTTTSDAASYDSQGVMVRTRKATGNKESPSKKLAAKLDAFGGMKLQSIRENKGHDLGTSTLQNI